MTAPQISQGDPIAVLVHVLWFIFYGQTKLKLQFMEEWNTIQVALELCFLLLFVYREKIFITQGSFAAKDLLSIPVCAQYSSLDPDFLNTTIVPAAAELIP